MKRNAKDKIEVEVVITEQEMVSSDWEWLSLLIARWYEEMLEEEKL